MIIDGCQEQMTRTFDVPRADASDDPNLGLISHLPEGTTSIAKAQNLAHVDGHHLLGLLRKGKLLYFSTKAVRVRVMCKYARIKIYDFNSMESEENREW